MFQISWKRKGAQLSREAGRDGPRRAVGSSARTFSSAGLWWPQARTFTLGDPPPFPSKPQRSKRASWRKRAAQNASETFSKVETPRGEPHPTHRMGSLPELAEAPPLSCRAASLQCRAASSQFVTSSCLAWGLEWECGELWTPIAEPRVERRAGVGLQFRGPSWP